MLTQVDLGRREAHISEHLFHSHPSPSWFCVAGYIGGDAFREELPDNGSACLSGDTDGGVGEDQPHSPVRVGIIQIGERSCANVAQKVRVVRHRLPTIAARDNRKTCRMDQAGLKGAGALIEVAWILVEERGEDRMAQEFTAASIAKLSGKPFAVTRGTLAVAGIGVIRLLDAGSETHADQGNRIKSVV